jgi:hypothetical protein
MKDDDGNILGPLTQLISGGELQITGRSNSGGVYRYGWITSKSKLFLYPGTQIDVHLELPSYSGTSDYYWRLVLHARDTDNTAPTNEDDIIDLMIYADTANYYQRVAVVRNTIWSTLNIAGSPEEITNSEGTFRLKVGNNGFIQVFFHDGSDEIDEENDEVVSLQDWNLNFDVAYVSFELTTGDTTNRTCISNEVTVSYPEDIRLKYTQDNIHLTMGDVELWDGDPDGGGVRVYGKDHVFSGDPYVQNDLIRLHIDVGVYDGFNLYYWTGSAWSRPLEAILLCMIDENVYPRYPYLKHIELVSRDEVIIVTRWHEDAVEDDDYYIDVTMTMKRGQRYISVTIDKVWPIDEFFFQFTNWVPVHRWGYTCDAETYGIADNDLSVLTWNQTMSDNFQIAFDDDTDEMLAFLATQKYPESGTPVFSAWQGGKLTVRDCLIRTGHIFYLGITPFPQIANLFIEAEDMHYTLGAVNEDVAGDSGTSMRLEIQNAYVEYQAWAGKDLPAGRYLAIWRVRDSNQVALDLEVSVYNSPDSEYRNEEQGDIHKTVTGSWAYYQLVFDIEDADASGIDTIRFRAKKETANANNIYVDYLLLVPIGTWVNQDWPQDIAHSALRVFDQQAQIFKKIGDDQVVG